MRKLMTLRMSQCWRREASRPMLANGKSWARILPNKESEVALMRQVSRLISGRPTQQRAGDHPENWRVNLNGNLAHHGSYTLTAVRGQFTEEHDVVAEVS